MGALFEGIHVTNTKHQFQNVVFEYLALRFEKYYTNI